MKYEDSDQAWYALQVRSRWEKSTAEILASKGYETFVPCYHAEARSKDMRARDTALFPGYAFCRFDVHDRLPILITPGVVAIVGNGRKPISVEDSEIENLQAAMISGVAAEPWPYLEVGQRVRIESGPLIGLEGLLTAIKGCRRVVLSVSLLRRSVALELDRTEVSAARQSSGGLFDSVGPEVLETALA